MGKGVTAASCVQSVTQSLVATCILLSSAPSQNMATCGPLKPRWQRPNSMLQICSPQTNGWHHSGPMHILCLIIHHVRNSSSPSLSTLTYLCCTILFLFSVFSTIFHFEFSPFHLHQASLVSWRWYTFHLAVLSSLNVSVHYIRLFLHVPGSLATSMSCFV